MIDAKENWHVVTCDIPGAFLQIDMRGEDDIYVMVKGQMAELLAKYITPRLQRLNVNPQ